MSNRRLHHPGIQDSMMDMDISSIVTPFYEGIRLDAYLAIRFTYHSRSQWQKEIRSGRILYDGRVMEKEHKKVKSGTVIRYLGGDNEEPDVDDRYRVLHEDCHILAVDKPSNLPVHPAGIFFRNTLLSFLERDLGISLFPIHRLDRETSGIILFGKSPEAASAVHRNFDSVKKEYLAIVHGAPREERFTVNVPIGKDLNSVIRKKRAAYENAEEEALTDFVVDRHLGPYTLLRVYPSTGRQHQIRVHALYAGHPIVGDKMYGKDEKAYLEFIKGGYSDTLLRMLEFPRCALHARSIVFRHPDSGEEMRLSSPMPSDMGAFVAEKDALYHTSSTKVARQVPS